MAYVRTIGRESLWSGSKPKRVFEIQNLKWSQLRVNQNTVKKSQLWREPLGPPAPNHSLQRWWNWDPLKWTACPVGLNLYYNLLSWITTLPLSTRFCFLWCVTYGRVVFPFSKSHLPRKGWHLLNSDIFRDWVRDGNRESRVPENSDPVTSRKIKAERTITHNNSKCM